MENQLDEYKPLIARQVERLLPLCKNKRIYPDSIRLSIRGYMNAANSEESFELTQLSEIVKEDIKNLEPKIVNGVSPEKYLSVIEDYFRNQIFLCTDRKDVFDGLIISLISNVVATNRGKELKRLHRSCSEEVLGAIYTEILRKIHEALIT